MTKNLKYIPYGNAHIEINNGNVALVSYVTKVAEIDADGWLTIRGLYSMTTRKHIGAFVKECVIFPNGEHMTYQDAKWLYEHGNRFNIHTGEIQEI